VPNSTGEPGAYELAYREATRAIEVQMAALDTLRTRASVLLTAAAVVTGFLAPAAGIEWAAGVAGISFAIAAGASLYVLLATTKVRPSTNAKALLADYIESDPPASLPEIHRSLAYYMQDDWEGNERELERRFRALLIAGGAIAAETIFWLVAIFLPTGGPP